MDIATSSYPEETKQIFPRTADIGIEHGTVLVLDGDEEYEVTTFRTEDVYVDYRRPSSVSLFVHSKKISNAEISQSMPLPWMRQGKSSIYLNGLKDFRKSSSASCRCS